MIITEYQNGNTFVTIMSDGTKIREYEGVPEITHPESIDVKITDYCDLGCAYCHESSTVSGIHGDLDMLLDTISDLPAGVELAIGGGNPLSHPNLVTVLQAIKTKGLIANITINQGHLKPYHELITYLVRDGLVHGIGISITNKNFNYIKYLLSISDNVVYHLIAGVNSVSIIDTLIELGKCKVLVLGYKQFGFGVRYYNTEIEQGIKEWYRKLPSYVGKCVLSFDNLAIEQLSIKRLFTDEGWNRFYMGDDFQYTMYIDAVKQEFAPTSRAKERMPFSATTLLNYFSNK